MRLLLFYSLELISDAPVLHSILTLVLLGHLLSLHSPLDPSIIFVDIRNPTHQALRLDAGNLKAQYRMAQALAGMSDFAEAKRVCAAAVCSAAADTSITADFRRLHAEIARTDAKRTAAQRAFEQTMGRRMQEKLATGAGNGSGAGTASGAGSVAGTDTGTSGADIAGSGTTGTSTDADTSAGTGTFGTDVSTVSQTAEGSVVISAAVTADEARP